MSEGLYALLGALGGALITGIFTYLAGKADRDFLRMRNHISNLSEQVSGYWLLERNYSQALSKLQKRTAKAVLETMRLEVEKSSGIRPHMTKNQAEKIHNVYAEK